MARPRPCRPPCNVGRRCTVPTRHAGHLTEISPALPAAVYSEAGKIANKVLEGVVQQVSTGSRGKGRSPLRLRNAALGDGERREEWRSPPPSAPSVTTALAASAGSSPSLRAAVDRLRHRRGGCHRVPTAPRGRTPTPAEARLVRSRASSSPAQDSAWRACSARILPPRCTRRSLRVAATW